MQVEEFLRESNAIEGVYDEDSFQQALYAWEYLIGHKTMTIGVVLKTHKILMLHQPLWPDEKGYFRKRLVSIGGRIVATKAIPHLMDVWIEQMNNSRDIHLNDSYKEAISKKLHVHYESIHPFIDGNGRTGRMFMNWWRLQVGLPILIIKEKEKQKYYKWFR